MSTVTGSALVLGAQDLTDWSCSDCDEVKEASSFVFERTLTPIQPIHHRSGLRDHPSMSNLTLQPLSLVAVPDPALAPEFAAFKASLLTSSNALLASLGAKPSTEWKKGKTFNKSTAPTRTASSKLPSGGGDTLGYKWHARTSRHGADWGELRDALVVRHSEQEQEYIESCSEAKRIHVWEEGVLEGEYRQPCLRPAADDSL
jgi:hypothetical protein